MMARTHALSGSATWLAAVPVVEGAAGSPLGAPEIVAGAVVTAGAALLPDLDHPKATIARALGPVSYLLSRAVSAAAGGHRQATHSLLAVVAVGAVMWGVVEAGVAPAAGSVIAGLCVGLAVRSIGPLQMSRGGWLDVTLISWTVVLTAVGVWAVDTMAWLPLAVTGGFALHLVGEFLTPGGIPLFWPHRRRYAAAALGTTNGFVEHLVTAALTLATIWLGVGLLG